MSNVTSSVSTWVRWLKMLLLNLTTIFLLAGPGCLAQNCSRFMEPVTGCTCVGDSLVYECTAFGPGTTQWEGTAFSSECNSITLRHSQFSSPGARGSCDNINGRIVGRSVDVVGQCFTSLLNVTISDSSLDGTNILCVHVNNGVRKDIGIHTIAITTDQNPLPPPNNVKVVDVHQYVVTKQLAFNWTSGTLEICPYANFVVTDIGCGTCPRSTRSSHVICQNAILGNTCSFVVSTIACGVVGSHSNSVLVKLKVPNAPTIHSVPFYDDGTAHLQSILTMFEESEGFEISEGIDGSVVFYTIIYTDALSGDSCNSTTIPASDCVNRMCSHVFEASSSKCAPFSDINITVFGTNLLGNGTLSNRVTIDSFNQFVQIQFSLLTLNVICMFISPKINKNCNIEYGPRNNNSDCANTSLLLRSENRVDSTSSSSVTITLPEFPQRHSLQNQFCFIITASDDVSTVQVAGTFNAGCDPQQLSVSDGTHAPLSDDSRCRAPLHSLSIKNGIVCYTGVDTGSIAFYSCSNCDSGAIISVRTCQLNGNWNGTVPQCDCSAESDATSLGFTVSLSLVALGLVVTSVILIVLVIMMIFLTRAKAKVQQKLKQATASALYDEIGIIPSIIESSSNVAYSSAINKLSLHEVSSSM